MSWIKSTCLVLVVTLVLLLLLELILFYGFGYRTISTNATCNRKNAEKGYSYYQKNCVMIIKHWEQNEPITYHINSSGRRDDLFEGKADTKKIAFIGDSFTFGAMVPIEKNYNYLAVYGLLGRRYEAHNYGVSGEEFLNIINKLNDIDFSSYEHIVYGLTPNDLFNLTDNSQFQESLKVRETLSNRPSSEYKINSMIKAAKNIALSSATSRFLLHELMSNDRSYLAIYESRKPYSGYLYDNYSEEWREALNIFRLKITSLPLDIKNKLKIFILPQRAEVILFRKGLYKDNFSSQIMSICRGSGIDCGFANLSNLSQLKESHFPVDGHLTLEGNKSVAQDFSNWVNSW